MVSTRSRTSLKRCLRSSKANKKKVPQRKRLDTKVELCSTHCRLPVGTLEENTANIKQQCDVPCVAADQLAKSSTISPEASRESIGSTCFSPSVKKLATSQCETSKLVGSSIITGHISSQSSSDTCNHNPSPSSVDDLDELCVICGDGESHDSNLIVFCEGQKDCKVVVHQHCYGILLIPENDEPWICDRCSWQSKGLTMDDLCIVCAGGCKDNDAAVKRVDKSSTRVFHVVCGLGHPYFSFRNRATLSGLRVPKRNEVAGKKLKCLYCSTVDGYKVTCVAKSCEATFHVRCGSRCGAQLTMDPDGGRKQAHCASHAILSCRKNNTVAPPSLQDVPTHLREVMSTRWATKGKWLQDAKPGRKGPSDNDVNNTLSKLWEQLDKTHFQAIPNSEEYLVLSSNCIRGRVENVHLCPTDACEHVHQRKKRVSASGTLSTLDQVMNAGSRCQCSSALRSLDEDTLKKLELKYPEGKMHCASASLSFIPMKQRHERLQERQPNGTFALHVDVSQGQDTSSGGADTHLLKKVKTITKSHMPPPDNTNRIESLRYIQGISESIIPGRSLDISRPALFNAAAVVMARDFDAFSESSAAEAATVLSNFRKGKMVDMPMKRALNTVISLGTTNCYREKSAFHHIDSTEQSSPGTVIANSVTMETDVAEVDHEIWSLQCALETQREANVIAMNQFLKEVKNARV